MPPSSKERDRWNQKYRESVDSCREPDPFLPYAFAEYIRPLFPDVGHALDLAGGTGRHAIWLARQGWEATLIDIANVGIAQAQQNSGALASRVHCVEGDLTRFEAHRCNLIW